MPEVDCIKVLDDEGRRFLEEVKAMPVKWDAHRKSSWALEFGSKINK